MSRLRRKRRLRALERAAEKTGHWGDAAIRATLRYRSDCGQEYARTLAPWSDENGGVRRMWYLGG